MQYVDISTGHGDESLECWEHHGISLHASFSVLHTQELLIANIDEIRLMGNSKNHRLIMMAIVENKLPSWGAKS